MTINLNSEVKLFPTELGIIEIQKILKSDFIKYHVRSSITLQEYYDKYITKDGELIGTMWEIISIFHSMIYFGNHQLWNNASMEIINER